MNAPRSDAQAQAVQADEPGRVALVVAAGATPFERGGHILADGPEGGLAEPSPDMILARRRLGPEG